MYFCSMNKKKKIIAPLIFLFIGTCFYLMNKSTPLRCDDLVYQFQWLDVRNLSSWKLVDLSKKVSSFSDAFNSQVNHYYIMNGRFIIHYMVQCFCGFLDKTYFNIFNTLMYFLFLHGCILLTGIKTSYKTIIAACLLWLGLPIQYIFYYSISFAVNYLWTSTALIYLLLLVRHENTKNKLTRTKCFILFVLSLLFGSLHEGFSIPLSGALFLYLIYNRKQLNASYVIIAAGVGVGTAILILSPGTIGRGSGTITSIDFQDFLSKELEVLRYSKRLLILILTCLLLYIFQRDTIIEFTKKRFIEICFILLDFGFVLIVPHYSQRIAFPLEMLSLLLTIELLFKSKLWDIKKYRLGITIVIVPIFLIHMTLTLYYTQVVNNEYRMMLNEYVNSPKGVTHYQELNIPQPFKPYVKRLDSDIEREYISFVMGKNMVIEE